MLQTVTHPVGERASIFLVIFSDAGSGMLERRWPIHAPAIDKTARIKDGKSFPEERALPLYEYRCTACGYSFEKIQSFSAKPETECPKCQGVLIRPVTAPALRFEGAGWYVNDYAGKGGAKKADGAADTPAADGAKESKSESKAETTAASTETKSAPATPAAAPSTASTPASGS
jgi:putative FmdB family regulatory protein